MLQMLHFVVLCEVEWLKGLEIGGKLQARSAGSG